MKRSISALLITVAAITFYSCLKETARPVSAVSTLQQNSNATAALKNPSLGDYNVQLYIENRNTSTKEFTGYVFTFKPKGVVLATVDSTTYTGKWESKDNGKKLKLDIKGTDALNDVSQSWDVVEMSNTIISLKNNQGKFGNKLVFGKI